MAETEIPRGGGERGGGGGGVVGGRYIIARLSPPESCEPVWPNGKAI